MATTCRSLHVPIHRKDSLEAQATFGEAASKRWQLPTEVRNPWPRGAPTFSPFRHMRSASVLQQAHTVAVSCSQAMASLLQIPMGLA